MKLAKRLVDMLFVGLVLAFVFGCSRPESRLTGKWVEEGKGDTDNYFEFFSDKTVIMKGPDYPFSGTWSILNDGRIKANFDVPLGGKIAVLGKMDGQAFIIEMDGKTARFVKMSTVDQKRATANLNYEFTVTVDCSIAEIDNDSALAMAKLIIGQRLKDANVSGNITVSDAMQLIIRVGPTEQTPLDTIRHLITAAGFLEFRMVHPKNDELVKNLFQDRKVPDGYEIVSMPGRENGDLWFRKGPPPSEAERAMLRRFEEKVGYDLLLEKEVIEKKDYFRPCYVNRSQVLRGDSLQSASVVTQQLGQKAVKISFDEKGRKIFAKVTADNAPGGPKNPDPNGHRHIGIVCDGVLYSTPLIRASISSGEVVIDNMFTPEEARELALILKAGTLPCPARIILETKL